MKSSQSPRRVYMDSMRTAVICLDSTQTPHGPNVECRKYSHGVPMESSWSPHGVHIDSARTVRSPHGLHANSWASVKYSSSGASSCEPLPSDASSFSLWSPNRGIECN